MDRRMVVVVMMVLFLPLNASAGQWTIALLPGIGLSDNLGEETLAPAINMESSALNFLGKERIRLNSGILYDAADKDTGSGWLGKGSSALQFFISNRTFVTAGYSVSVRDGGKWRKRVRYTYGGGGFEFGHRGASWHIAHQLHLIIAVPVASSHNSKNRERYVQAGYRYERIVSRSNRWAVRLEVVPTVLSYLNSDGSGPRHVGSHVYGWVGIVRHF